MRLMQIRRFIRPAAHCTGHNDLSDAFVNLGWTDVDAQVASEQSPRLVFKSLRA